MAENNDTVWPEWIRAMRSRENAKQRVPRSEEEVNAIRLPDRGLMTVIGLRKELLGRDGEGAADEEEETDRDGGSGGGDEGRGEQKTPTRNKLFATYSRALQCCFIIFFTLPATTNPGSLLHRASLCFTVAIVCLGLHVDFP